ALPRHWESLVADIASGGCRCPLPASLRRDLHLPARPVRAKELEDVVPEPYQTLLHLQQSFAGTLWPRLRVVSCWGDAHGELALTEIQSRLPGIFVQPKGLLATEAVVTIPFAGAWPLALRSHFFEFIDERGRTRLADELEDSGEYEVVVTTSGGLW